MEKISGIGVDCIEISRFENLISKERIPDNLFTDNEKKYCLSKSYPAQHFAARFVAKEAIIKAYNQSEKENLLFKEIEIFNDKRGLPIARLLNKKKNELEILVSLSHSDTLAMAFVVIKKVYKQGT